MGKRTESREAEEGDEMKEKREDDSRIHTGMGQKKRWQISVRGIYNPSPAMSLVKTDYPIQRCI